MKFSRHFAMPSADTFSIAPISAFVDRYRASASVIIDPFARNNTWATYTNDLSPDTKATYHLDAVAFCKMLRRANVTADLGIYDPPYSPRQISEVYAGIGRRATMQDTQSSWYTKSKNALNDLIQPEGVVLSFGWNTTGFGLMRCYKPIEIMLVCHGGAHNDTICMAARKQGCFF